MGIVYMWTKVTNFTSRDVQNIDFLQEVITQVPVKDLKTIDKTFPALHRQIVLYFRVLNYGWKAACSLVKAESMERAGFKGNVAATSSRQTSIVNNHYGDQVSRRRPFHMVPERIMSHQTEESQKPGQEEGSRMENRSEKCKYVSLWNLENNKINKNRIFEN